MGGGTTHSNTVQNDGIKITTNAAANSINNYSGLTVDGSKSTTKSTATGAKVNLGLSFLQNMPSCPNGDCM